MVTHKVAVLPGDGVGPEVIAEGRKVLDTVAEVKNFEIEWNEYPHGADYYLSTKELISEDTAKAYASNKGIVGRGIDAIKSERGQATTDLLGKLEVDKGYGKPKKPW